MDFISHYECTLCGKKLAADLTSLTCPDCGLTGILDVKYDYEAMKKTVTRDYFRSNTDASMWRYAPLMSLKTTDFSRALRVGNTPHYRSHTLEKTLGSGPLYFKDEGANPTGSLKDRASAVGVFKAIEAEKKTIACASTGNAASSLAGNAARMGLDSVIFVPKRAPKGKLAQLQAYGAHLVRIEGDYKATFEMSRKAIESFGWYDRNAAINPHLVEGKKTVAYEIAEQMDFDVPEWVCVSVGDGCTIAGLYKGFLDFFSIGLTRKIPKLLGVQSEGCAPFHRAWKNKTALIETQENTIADSIAVGLPRNPVKGMEAVRKSGGAFITVSDQAILDSALLLGSKEGLFGEPAAAASLAGLVEAYRQNIITADARVTVIITGNGLKDPDSIRDKIPEPVGTYEESDVLRQYLRNHKEEKS